MPGRTDRFPHVRVCKPERLPGSIRQTRAAANTGKHRSTSVIRTPASLYHAALRPAQDSLDKWLFSPLISRIRRDDLVAAVVGLILLTVLAAAIYLLLRLL